VTQNRRVQLFT